MKGEENTMTKVIVAILGVLVGSILPIATAPIEFIPYAILIAAVAIILCCCFTHDVARFFAIFIAGGILGCCIAMLISGWHELFKEISLTILICLAVMVTAVLGKNSQDEKEKRQKRKEPKETE